MTKKKLLLVGMINRHEAFEFMNVLINELPRRYIDVVRVDYKRIRFETPHTNVWFLWPDYRIHDLTGVRADGIFGHAVTDEMLARAANDAVISNRDRIGLVDYICRVEREATENLYPKSIYISTAGLYDNELWKRWMNSVYGAANRGSQGTVFYAGRGGGKTQIALKYLEKEFWKNVEKEIVYGGENNMPTEAAQYVRQDIASLAAAFKRVNDAFNKKLPGIKNVHFSGPVTVVIWEDKTKTIVRCKDNDVIDYEKGLAMAIAKKALGTNKSGSNYYDIFKKWLPEEEEPIVIDYSTAAKEAPAEEVDATCQE